MDAPCQTGSCWQEWPPLWVLHLPAGSAASAASRCVPPGPELHLGRRDCIQSPPLNVAMHAGLLTWFLATSGGSGSGNSGGGIAAEQAEQAECPLEYRRLSVKDIQGGQKPYLLGGAQQPTCTNCARSDGWATVCQFKSGQLCSDWVQQGIINNWVERGYELALGLTPCDLWPLIQGRTLFLMGDSMMLDFYKASQGRAGLGRGAGQGTGPQHVVGVWCCGTGERGQLLPCAVWQASSRQQAGCAPLEAPHQPHSCLLPAADVEGRCQRLGTGQLAGLAVVDWVGSHQPRQQAGRSPLDAPCRQAGGQGRWEGANTNVQAELHPAALLSHSLTRHTQAHSMQWCHSNLEPAALFSPQLTKRHVIQPVPGAVHHRQPAGAHKLLVGGRHAAAPHRAQDDTREALQQQQFAKCLWD